MSDDEPTKNPRPQRGSAAGRRAIKRIRSGVAAAKDPVVDRLGQAASGVERTWSELPGARVRRVRRMGSMPLPYLYDVHPEARSARPIEVGLETIDIEDI